MKLLKLVLGVILVLSSFLASAAVSPDASHSPAWDQAIAKAGKDGDTIGD